MTLENVRECPFEIDLCVQGQSIHITGWRTKRIQPQLVTTTAVLTTKKRSTKIYRIKTGHSTQMKETSRGRETKMREFSEEGTPRGRNSFSVGKPGPYTKVLPKWLRTRKKGKTTFFPSSLISDLPELTLDDLNSISS